MTFRLAFLLLSITLSIKFSCAATLQQNTQHSAQKIAKVHFLESIFASYNTVQKVDMANKKRLADAVLKDQFLLDHKSVAMYNYLLDFLKFIAKLNDLGDEPYIAFSESEKPQELLDETAKLFDQFKQPVTKEGELIKSVLIENGIADAQKVLEPAMKAYGTVFIKAAENYLSSLNSLQSQSERKLITLLDKIKLADAFEQAELIYEYIKSIPDEEFDELLAVYKSIQKNR